MFLNRPFPLDAPNIRSLRLTAYAGLTVFAILALLQPFGIDRLPPATRLVHAFLFGAVTFIMTTVTAFLLPWLFPTWHNEQRWTVGREILRMCCHLLLVIFANVLLTHELYNRPLSLATLLSFGWFTLVVGIFPLGLNVFLKQQRLLKKYQSGAAVLDNQLQVARSLPEPEHPGEQTAGAVTFTSENGKEQFTVAPEALRYVTSADNYIRICYVKGHEVHTHLLRNTLRKAEESLAAWGRFFRCHRMYLVNLDAVTHVSGNAQGYKLHLQHLEEVIPVSRSLNNTLTDQLKTTRLAS
jgi:hypothetical protein